jgi:hypothetical protein
MLAQLTAEEAGRSPRASSRDPGAPAVAPTVPVQVELNFADNTGQFVRLVDARIDGRSARVTSEQLGRRSRLIASAPGGR